MEIRNALQKIENYLTVVSNLNKTILSEGTMSRDELLLMKKYLYTSIDRIEDIERSLIIDKREDKSFTPTATLENKIVPAKEKEIVEVTQNEHIEEVEAALLTVQNTETEAVADDIQAEMEQEEMLFVGQITSVDEEQPAETPNIIEIAPLVESIITEDYSLNTFVENKVEEVVEENTIPVFETQSFVDSIITEDYSLNRFAENKVEETAPVESAPLSEPKSFVESIITEDYTLNRLFEDKTEETEIETFSTPAMEKVTQVESIITEDYTLNKLQETTTTVQETLVAKFEDQTPTTFAEELANKKKEETSLFEHMEQKLNATPQSQLFEMFDDGSEELHETFANNTFSEPVSINFDRTLTATVYEEKGSVLVAEKEVETIRVEQLTPSSLNEIFKPQATVENITANAGKTLSESIALNDKFIFVRELFGNHFGEYEAGLKQLEALNSFEPAEKYCKDKLWNKYNWNEKTAAVERFMSSLQKRFN